MRDRAHELWIDTEVLRLTNIRAAQNRKAGNPGPEGSIAKLKFAELNKDVYELCVDLLGPAALDGYDYEMRRAESLGLVGRPARRARCSCGRGPTRSRAARRRSSATSSVSGCWACPASRVDKEMPWSQVPRS